VGIVVKNSPELEWEVSMVGVHDFPMFVVAGLLLAMSPGPDTAYILGRSAQSGWRGGAVAALGIAAGSGFTFWPPLLVSLRY